MRQRLQDIERRGHAKAARHCHGGLPGAEIQRMQHEPPRPLDRPAEMHPDIAPSRRPWNLQLIKQPGKAEVRGGPVHDDPHRPVARVGADQNHAFREARVAHAGHRNQDRTTKVHVGLLSCPRYGPPQPRPQGGQTHDPARSVARSRTTIAGM